MALVEHAPLDVTTLSPAGQKALAPGPVRMMAARGLAPLPRPAEVVAVLYQLAVTDPALTTTAVATATGLPEAIARGALADPAIDPRVVDWLALVAKAADRPALFDALALGPCTADDTIAAMASRGDAKQIDLIAQNEARLLRHPAIIAAMYQNPHARMSTVDRVVELAVRNQIRVPGLACWDEVARAIAGGAPAATAADDAAFALAATTLARLDDSALTTGDAEHVTMPEDGEAPPEAPKLDEKDVPIGKMTVAGKIRLATLGNAFARAVLIRDPLKMVSIAAIKSPGVTEIEAARYATNSGLSDDVIRYIAGRREWTKLYSVKMALITNPKTPIPEAMRLMPFLREKDLVNVARSKGVSAAIVQQARKLISQRKSGGNKGG
jgi:hypothetical protein